MNPTSTTRQDPAGAVIPGRRVRLSSEAARVCGPGHGQAAEPQVILIRNGDTVEAIEVVCTCGERIRLKCWY